MATKTPPIVPLAELENGQEADFFCLLTLKEELKTRDGKPYWRVGFRDAGREVVFPVWSDVPWADECRRHWTPGVFYKLRAVYRETSYGPQLEIKRIRETVEADAADGFDPLGFLPCSRYDPAALFDEVCELARERIANEPLRELVLHLYATNRERLLTLPAATKNHHAFVGGYLEHVRSVTQTAVFFAAKYAAYYDDLSPPLDADLVVAGALLHDIGKLRELELHVAGPAYTPAGSLIGHVLQGRDMVREAAAELARREPPLVVDPETLLRLEHVVVAHQRLPEWGAPKPPMTAEALLVHYADDADAKFNMLYNILRDDATPGHVTSKKNVLTQAFYKGKP